MNYLSLLNRFFRYPHEHRLSCTAQALWFRLVMLCNFCGWPEWITAGNLRLMDEIGVAAEKTLIKHRQELITAGLIAFEAGGKGHPCRYKILCIPGQ